MQKKFKSEFLVFGWFPGFQNLDVLLESLLQSKFKNHFQADTIH